MTKTLFLTKHKYSISHGHWSSVQPYKTGTWPFTPVSYVALLPFVENGTYLCKAAEHFAVWDLKINKTVSLH